jgi:hypothetical protein
MDLAAPLQPADRSQFLRDVADQLVRYPDVGDGLVTRVAGETQKQYVGIVRGTGTSKYR